MSPETNPLPETEERQISRDYINKLESYLEAEDIEYLLEEVLAEDGSMDSADVLGYAYGRLLELGYYPDDTLAGLGITEEE